MSISSNIKEKTEKVLAEYEGRPLNEIATENNIKVFSLNLSDISEGNISGAILKESDGTYTIYLNSSDNKKRQRFTFAHELGHFFLHKEFLEKTQGHIDKNSPYLFRSSDHIFDELDPDKKIMEQEANYFAAEILMPSKQVRKLWKTTNDIVKLSEFFDVSITAMSYRIENLKLIS